MKKIVVACIVLVLCIVSLAAQDIVPLGGSNQNRASAGFVFNEYDALVNPLYFASFISPSLFFALDSSTSLLGENLTAGSAGFRAGMILKAPAAPRFLLNYADSSTAGVADLGQNTIVDSVGYDLATGLYGTITETITYDPSYSTQTRDLIFHAGLLLSPSFSLALQAAWNQRAYASESVSYVNTYGNTVAISPTSLTTRGNLTETSIDAFRDGDALSVELEGGLSAGAFKSLIALGASLNGLSGSNEAYSQSVTNYSGGLDPTLRDTVSINRYQGACYYDGSAVSPLLSMTGPLVLGGILGPLPGARVKLDSRNSLSLASGAELSFPVAVSAKFYGPRADYASVTEISGYDDALATEAYISQTTTTTAIDFTSDYDIDAELGLGLSQEISASEQLIVKAGANLLARGNFLSHGLAQSLSIRTVLDGDADGVYGEAGTDTDTLFSQSGYEIRARAGVYDFSLDLPLGLSYKPTGKLSFNAGSRPTLSYTLFDVSALRSGSASYMYESFTDNLVGGNSYALRQIDGSDNLSNSDESLWGYLGFSVQSGFGFTMKLTDKLSVDALATASNLSFSNFSVVGTLAF